MKFNCAANVKHKQRDAIKAPHSHESSTSQSGRHSVCVSLVWLPLHQGGGAEGNTIWPVQGSAWKEKYSKSCPCFFCLKPEICHLWCCIFHLTFLVFNPGNSPCQQQCTSVGGRPHCSCFPGFSLMTDGVSCMGEQPKRFKTCLLLLFLGHPLNRVQVKAL